MTNEKNVKPKYCMSAEMPIICELEEKVFTECIADPLAHRLAEAIEKDISRDIQSSKMRSKTGRYRVSVYYAVEVEDISKGENE